MRRRRRRLRPGAAPGRRGRRWPTTPSTGSPTPAPGSWSPAATTTPRGAWASTPASSTSPASTCAPTPHAVGEPGAARGRRTVPSRSTASPTSSPTSCARLGAADPRPPRRDRPRARPGARRPRHAARPAPARSCSPTRSSPAGCPATASATSRSAASRWSRWSSSPGFDYVALGHLHGRARAHRHRPLQRLPRRLLLLRGPATARGPGWSSSAPTGSPRSGSSTLPSSVRWRASRAPSRSCSPTPRLTSDEDSWVQATLTDAVRPVQAMDRLRVRFPHALALRFAPAGGGPTSPPLGRRRPDGPRDLPRLRRAGARRTGRAGGVRPAPGGARVLPRRRRTSRASATRRRAG